MLMCEPSDAIGKLGSLMHCSVCHTVLLACALGRRIMTRHDHAIKRWTVLKLSESSEYSTATVVEQQYPEVAAQVAMPQGIDIIEEAQVANDAVYWYGTHQREACRCRQRPLDAVDTAVHIHISVGIEQACPDRHAVGKMNAAVAAVYGLKELPNCCHLRILWVTA